MSLLNKFTKHFQRLRNARRLGVSFSRRSSFVMPKQIRLKQIVAISYPPEHGVSNDFLACAIDDAYGLSQIEDSIETIADIGGNVGFFTLAARSWFPQAKIHIYEPNPRILPHLETNASNASAKVFSEAVGATDGVVTLEDNNDSNQARTVPLTEGKGIPQVAFATLIKRLGGRLDLAKIDCEGAEWDMFTDTESWKKIHHVRMEYHLLNKYAVDDVHGAFDKLNFEILLHEPSGQWGTIWCRNRAF